MIRRALGLPFVIVGLALRLVGDVIWFIGHDLIGGGGE